MQLTLRHAVLALALLASACQGTRKLTDPVLEIRSDNGAELGVATDYGLVFLGRTARSGPIDVTAWYGDGPSVESTVVEPLGGGLFTAMTEIKLPCVPMSFITPKPGSELIVIGRSGRARWEAKVRVRSDPKIEGLLLSIPSQLAGHDEQLGAGVYVLDELTGQKRLVGLVSGKVALTTADGVHAEYLTAVGPSVMWRLLTFRRDYPHKRRFVYRDDIL
jgi:hypothetical protein